MDLARLLSISAVFREAGLWLWRETNDRRVTGRLDRNA